MSDENDARDLVVNLGGVLRGLGLYDRNNSTIVRLLDTIEAVCRRSADGYAVQLLTDEFFVNGRLLHVDANLYERFSVLAAGLAKLGVGEIRFPTGVSRDDLDRFGERLSTAIRAGGSRFSLEPCGGIRFAKPAGSAIAVFRFEPDRLALSVVAGLLDLVDRLREEHAAGRAPSLLPIKRSLQLVIDGTAGSGGLYELLGSVRDPATPVGDTRLCVASCLTAVGFGVSLGVGRDALLTLGLASILGGLVPEASADATVAPLLRFAGLGDAAMGLILAVHDARSLGEGRPVGMAGQIVALARAYRERTLRGRPPVAAARFSARLAAEGFAGVDPALARAFAAWLGPYPVGSLVKAGNGRVGVVIGGERLLVAMFGADGVPGAPLEARPEAIASTPVLEEVGLQLR